MALRVLLVDLGRFFRYLILYTVGRTPWTRDQPVARPLPTHRTTPKQNKRTQTSMPWVRLEPIIPMFEGAKAVHILYRAATVIGSHNKLIFQKYITSMDYWAMFIKTSYHIEVSCIGNNFGAYTCRSQSFRAGMIMSWTTPRNISGRCLEYSLLWKTANLLGLNTNTLKVK
jgi:hypothetical protein